MNRNQPAFPQTLTDNQGRMDTPDQYGAGGLTKRELIAAMAMPSLINKSEARDIDKLGARKFREVVAAGAVALADALLAELERTEPK